MKQQLLKSIRTKNNSYDTTKKIIIKKYPIIKTQQETANRKREFRAHFYHWCLASKSLLIRNFQNPYAQ